MIFADEEKRDDSDVEDVESRVMASVDIKRGTIWGQPSWSDTMNKQLNAERLHSHYLSRIKPVLSAESEDSLWEEDRKGRIGVMRLLPPSPLDLRLAIPKEALKWHFDDSDDEKDDVIAAKRAAAEAKASKARHFTSQRATVTAVWQPQVKPTAAEVEENVDSFDVDETLPSKERTRLRKEREKKTKADASAKAKLEREAKTIALELKLVADADKGSAAEAKAPGWVDATADLFAGARDGNLAAVEEAIEALQVLKPPLHMLAGKYGESVTGRAVDLMDDPHHGGRGFTALMYACEANSTAVTSFLIKKAGAAVELCDPLGLTALHIAAAAGSLECVHMLVHFAGKGRQSLEGLAYEIFRGHGFAGEGATPRRPPQPPREECDEPADDPYAAAAVSVPGDGKKSKAPEPPKNGTALYWAAAHGRLQVVEYLVEMYKPLMDESQNEEGDSPLWAAIFHRRLSVAKFLLEAGADAIAANNCGVS